MSKGGLAMIDFEGKNCIACGEILQDNDDIVVCPECGTPYHRACYQNEGRCINNTLHNSGQSWQKAMEQAAQQRRSEEKRLEEAEQQAERERGDAPHMFNETLYDGVRINPDAPYVGLDPTEDFGGVTLGELSDFVHTNRLYYIPLFRLMKRTGKKMSFNLTSLLFPEFFFANRKMWAMTLLSLAVQLISKIPMWISILIQMFDVQLSGIDVQSVQFRRLSLAADYTGMIFTIICCLFANYWYYRFSMRKISRMKKKLTDEENLSETLAEAGGTRWTNIVLAIVIELGEVVAVLAIASLLS